jgi:hypothetical protein
MWKLVVGPFRQEAIVLALGLTLFAVYLPIAAWLHRDVLVADRPTGLLVEPLRDFEPSADGGYQARVYGNASHKKGVLYEGNVPLHQVDITTLPPLPRTLRFIRMTPRDGSDPRINGRRYYLVQP